MKKNNKVRVMLVLCMLCIGLLAIPLTAKASAVHYGAGGEGYDSNGNKHYGYGTYGHSYLYPNQNPLDGIYWVNSLYASRTNHDNVEAGWSWTRDGTLQWFMTTWINDRYTEENFNGYYNTVNTWVPIVLRQRYDGTNNDDWEMYINGSRRHTMYNTGITSSNPSVGAERYDTNDYNLGSWKYISYLYKISSTQLEWRNWVRAQAEPLGSLQDPKYEFYGNRLGPSTNYWVYVDAQAN